MQIYHHNKIQFNSYDAVFEQNLYIFMTGTLASNNAMEKQLILKNKPYIQISVLFGILNS